MKNTILNLSRKLDSLVSDSGSSFSIGELQLLCLARALLKSSKIVVVEESISTFQHE